MKKKYIFLFNLFLITSIIYPQSIERIKHPYAGKLVMSLSGGITYPYTDYNSSKAKLFTEGSLAFYFNSNSKHVFGLRVIGGLGNVTAEDNIKLPNKFLTYFSYISGGFVYSYYAADKLAPYLYAGIGNIWYNPKDINENKLPNRIVNSRGLTNLIYHGQAGLNYFINDRLSLNVNVGLQTGNFDLLDGLSIPNSKNDLFMTASIGLSFAFRNLGMSNSNDDKDGDGIPDSEDKCPDTPKGVKVTVDGCPIDADGDGVPDINDECKNTPKGVFVGPNGCPVDSDGDRIPDYRDQCPDTPAGMTVNMFGCPLDRDGDGVPDSEDKCPNTPEGITVNEQGCPVGTKTDFNNNPPQTTTFKNYNPPTTIVTSAYNTSKDRNIRGRVWSDGNKYVVQQSSWRSKVRAERQVNRLIAKGHNAFIQKTYIPKFGRTYYRVRIGYFYSLSEALSYARKVR